MSLVSQARRLGLAVLFAVGATVRADSPLDVIPADAKIVVLVNNLEKSMQGSEKFAQAIGQPAPPSDLSQLTGFMGELGSQWKVNRGVGIAVIQPSQDGVVAVFPVDDGAAALKAVKAEMKGDVGSFDMFGQTVMGGAKGKHLLVSAGESSLKAFSGDKSVASAMTAAQTKLADSSSVFVYVNIQALKPMIEQGVADGDQLKKVFEKISEKHPQFNAEQMAEAVKKGVQALSKEAKSLYLGFQIDEKAAVVRVGVELLPESKARAKFAAYKATKPDLFATLPPTNFIAAFGIDAAGIANLDGTQEGPKVQGVSGAVSFDNGAASVMLRVDSPDASTIHMQLKGLIGIGQMMAQGQAQGKVEFANSEKKVGGSDVSEIVVKIKGGEPKAQEAMKAILGGSDIVMQHGVVGQAIGLTIGGKSDGFSALQAAGSLGASTNVKAAASMLPANSVFALLVDPIAVFQLAKKAARAAGEESPIATANVPDKPGFPMAAALSIESDGMMLHINVPSASIKEILPIMQQIN